MTENRDLSLELGLIVQCTDKSLFTNERVFYGLEMQLPLAQHRSDRLR